MTVKVACCKDLQFCMSRARKMKNKALKNHRGRKNCTCKPALRSTGLTKYPPKFWRKQENRVGKYSIFGRMMMPLNFIRQ